MSDSGNTSYVRCRLSFRHGYGWITCQDGTESEKFVTVSKGMKVLAKLVRDGKVPGGATSKLMRLIAISSLELKSDELDETFSAMLKEKEELLNHAYDTRFEEPDIVTRIEETMARASVKRILH